MLSRKKRILEFLVVLSIVILFSFFGCQEKGGLQGPEKPPTFGEKVPGEVVNLIKNYLIDEYKGTSNVYLIKEEPENAQDGDFRIDDISYAGEAVLEESIAVAYEIAYSRFYFTRTDAEDKGSFSWHQGQAYHIVLSKDSNGTKGYEIIGSHYSGNNKKVEDIILETAYSLMDIEVSISIDGYSQLMGPGSSPDFIQEEFTKDLMRDYEPIYGEGDCWVLFTYKDLSNLAYYNAQDNKYFSNDIKTSRRDVESHRGIRIGMTKEEVFSAYPEIKESPYWGLEGDYIWYSPWEGDFGPSLIFWLEEGMVTMIEMINMFD